MPLTHEYFSLSLPPNLPSYCTSITEQGGETDGRTYRQALIDTTVYAEKFKCPQLALVNNVSSLDVCVFLDWGRSSLGS